jgi:hypothetical protein
MFSKKKKPSVIDEYINFLREKQTEVVISCITKSIEEVGKDAFTLEYWEGARTGMTLMIDGIIKGFDSIKKEQREY